MRNIDLLTTWRTPNVACPACERRRLHTAEERTCYHPYSRHGFDGTKWSHHLLEPQGASRAMALCAAAAYGPQAQVTQRGNK